MLLVRRCRLSSLWRRHLPTILFFLFIFSLSALLLSTPDIHYNGKAARSDSGRSALNELQDRAEPPLPVLNQRTAYTNHEKSIGRNHQFGRGLLDRVHGSDGGGSQPGLQGSSNSGQQHTDIETENNIFPQQKPDDADSLNTIHHRISTKQNDALNSGDEVNSQTFQVLLNSGAQYKHNIGTGKDAAQWYPIDPENKIAVPNNGFPTRQQVNAPIVSNVDQRKPPSQNAQTPEVDLTRQRNPNNNAQAYIGSQVQQKNEPKLNSGQAAGNNVLSDNSLQTNINHNPAGVITQQITEQQQQQQQQQQQHQKLHAPISPNQSLKIGNVQQDILPNKQIYMQQTNLADQRRRQQQQQQLQEPIQQKQQQYSPISPKRPDDNVGNVQQVRSPSQQLSIQQVNLDHQEHQQQKIEHTSTGHLQQHQQVYNQQAQQIHTQLINEHGQFNAIPLQQKHQPQRQEQQQQMQTLQQQQVQQQQQQHRQVQQQQQPQTLQQQQVLQQQWQVQPLNPQQKPQEQLPVQRQTSQQKQQQQNPHQTQQQQIPGQQQQVQVIQRSQQQQQEQQQTDQRQNIQQQLPIGQTSNSVPKKNAIDSVQRQLQFNSDIVWGAEAEQAVPQAFTWDNVDDWTSRVRQQPIAVMETGSETKCGRAPNQYLELVDGTRLCARYRDSYDMEIEGELLSFYLSRLLDIKSVPPLVLAITNSQSSQWSAQRSQLTQANWKDGKVVTFTRFIDGLSSALFPKTLVSVKNGPPLYASSPGLKSLTSSELSYLVQWTDLIIFDYLLGHIDRVTNHQEGSDIHDDGIQHTIWLTQPIHNLAVGKNSVLWFIDNETGFRMGYRALYHNFVDGEKYRGFHTTMLHTNCVFRAGTVKKIDELYHQASPFERLMTMIDKKEPLAKFVKAEIPGFKNDVPDIFNERVGHVYKWMEECRVKT